MNAFIIQISWTFRGESGMDTLDKAFLDYGKAKEYLQKVAKSEQEDTWLNEVLDSDLKPLDDITLEMYEFSDDHFVVESEEYEGRTEVWIQTLDIE